MKEYRLYKTLSGTDNIRNIKINSHVRAASGDMLLAALNVIGHTDNPFFDLA